MKKIFLLMAVIFALSGCGSTEETAREQENTETVENIYAEDAQQLVYAVRAAHPVFVLDKVTEKYETAEKEFLENAENAADKNDFELMTQKYMASLDDEHTMPCPDFDNDKDSALANIRRYRLDLYCNYADGKLYIRNDDGTSSDSCITAVQGVDIEKIFRTVRAYYPFENRMSEEYYFRNMSLYRKILQLSGCDLTDESTEAEVVCSDRTFTAKFIDIYDGYYSDDYVKPENLQVKLVNDILYIDSNSFMKKDEKYAAAVKEIQNYSQNGVNKIILDLRGNGGGYMDFAKDVLRAFGTNLPYGESIIRHSSEEWVTCIKDLKTAAEDKTYTTNAGSLNSAMVNPDIDLVVLCDINSFSASVITCAGIQDGKIGTVIGRSSHNSPSLYASVLWYTLPNTGIKVQISSGYLKRADENAPQDILIPDEEVGIYENALKYAVENHYKETFNESDWK